MNLNHAYITFRPSSEIMFLPITSHLYLDYAHASVEPHLALFICNLFWQITMSPSVGAIIQSVAYAYT